MRRIVSGRRLGEILHRLGMLPPETSEVEIITPAGGPLQLRFTVHVTEEQLPLIAQAFLQLAETRDETS